MDSLDQYRARIFELVGSKSPEVLKAWLERQVYIALGFMMSCAADLRVDGDGSPEEVAELIEKEWIR